jgi:dTMP kinase
MVLKNFIVFEGIDGAGTSTQEEILSRRPEAESFFFTAEPTNLPTGVFLRQMLQGKFPLHAGTAAYLFAADRNEHIYGANGIIANLDNGKIVINDRYIFSSLAYQSIDCGMELPAVLNRNFPLPQILFFFDVEPEVSLRRIKNRGVVEIYEKLDFLKKTTEAYRSIIREYSQIDTGMQIIRIDASQPIEETSRIIWSYIKKIPILKT